jgi:hypothetical protein
MNEGRFVCGWCGVDMGPSGTQENSHGICPSCAKILRALAEQQAMERAAQGAGQ